MSLYLFSPILRNFAMAAELMVSLCRSGLSICEIRKTLGPSH